MGTPTETEKRVGLRPRPWQQVVEEAARQLGGERTLGPRNEGNDNATHAWDFPTGVVEFGRSDIGVLFVSVFKKRRDLPRKLVFEETLHNDEWTWHGSQARSRLEEALRHSFGRR